MRAFFDFLLILCIVILFSIGTILILLGVTLEILELTHR